MQATYLIIHFLTALLWVLSALALDLRFRRQFPSASSQDRLVLIRSIRSISGKTEMPATLILLVLGAILLMKNPMWFKVGIMHGKLTLAIVAIGLLHASRGVMKKMVAALEAGDSVERLAKKYRIMRTVVFVILLVIAAQILGYKASHGEPNSLHIIFGWS